MPIYEYVCHACDDEFEAMQKFSDNDLTTCTLCGKEGKVNRKLSLSAFQLKGGGWYKEGYGGSKSSGDSGGNGSSGAKAGKNGNSGNGGTGASKSGDSPSKSTSDKPASTGSSGGTSTSGGN